MFISLGVSTTSSCKQGRGETVTNKEIESLYSALTNVLSKTTEAHLKIKGGVPAMSNYISVMYIYILHFNCSFLLYIKLKIMSSSFYKSVFLSFTKLFIT